MAKPEPRVETEQLIAAAVANWAELWQSPSLPGCVTVQFSRRLRRTRGRSTPATGRVVLSADLLGDSPDTLLDVLCHEVAHVAVVLCFGARVRPHGQEWRALVERAGYTPSTHAIARRSENANRAQPLPRYPFVHVCPVCHTRRYARRPVSRWRCAECVSAGLAGELIVSRVADTMTGGLDVDTPSPQLL